MIISLSASPRAAKATVMASNNNTIGDNSVSKEERDG